MPLHSVPEVELRERCKLAIEGLEQWLRRLIHDRFSAEFGQSYIKAKTTNGGNLVRSELARKLEERRAQEPNRLARPIDAAMLDDEIDLICNPDHYKTYFKDALDGAFGPGAERVRDMLRRLVSPRNALYHANPISVHEAYRILCYSMDVVQSLKDYYAGLGMAQQYNVPTVLKLTDSLGHVVNLLGRSGQGMVDYSNDSASFLRCGDNISIEVEVDPSFDVSEYNIRWTIANIGGGPNFVGNKYTLHLAERYVSTRLCIVCWVASNKSWHRLGSVDDQIDVAYRVLPPI